jgi:hypothetical protein
MRRDRIRQPAEQGICVEAWVLPAQMYFYELTPPHPLRLPPLVCAPTLMSTNRSSFGLYIQTNQTVAVHDWYKVV